MAYGFMMITATEYSHIDLPAVSLHLAALFFMISLPLAAVIGFATGRARRKSVLASRKEVELVAGETTLSAILALLGLLLAFSFGNALSFSHDRKAAVTNEAATLGTAFLRADYLEDPGSRKLKEALLAYSKTRILPEDGSINSPEKAEAFLLRTLEAQAKLWPLTLEVTSGATPPPIKTFVAGAINDVLDAHLVRMQALSNPVSDITKAMMLAAALVALFLLGNRAGLMGRQLTWRIFVFSGFLFVVMLTIMDTERSAEGFVRMDESTLKATALEMQMALSASDDQ